MRPSRLLAAVLVTVVGIMTITASTTPSNAHTQHSQVWTARAATHVFPDSLPTDTGAGTTLDQVVKFFTDRGTVSRLEGFWVNGGPGYSTVWDVETLIRDADGKTVKKYVPWTSAEADDWIQQYVGALRDHVKARGLDRQVVDAHR